MAALVFKVGTLLLKQLAKPMAASFQSYVMNHPNARRMAIGASQYAHRFEVFVSRAAEGRTGRAFVADMNEEKAVELASKLVSEGFVFTVGAGIVFFEYDRQQKKETAKKKAEALERRAAEDKAREERETATRINHEQSDAIKALHERMEALEAQLPHIIEQAIAAHHTRKRGGLFGGFLGPRGGEQAAAVQ